jgi:hypothetical protein
MMSQMIKKAFILLLLLQGGYLFAGAVIRIDRIELKNGKKIFLFGEKHSGLINPELQNDVVCTKQFNPFLQLFSSFVNQKNNYVLFIEYNDWLRAKHALGGLTLGMPGCALAWFDRFYEGYRTNRTDWPFVAEVKNFDQRTPFDVLTLELFQVLTKIQKKYQESGYAQAVFDESKNRITTSGIYIPEYKEWKELFNSTPIAQFEKRLEQHMARLERLLSPADYQALFTLINQRTHFLAQYMYFESKARFLNTTTFDYILDLIGSAKDNFYPELTEFVRSDVPLQSPYILVSFINVITDLSLLETILTDPHPVLLVSLGASHVHYLIESFFKQSEMTRSVRTLNMLDPQMLNNPEYAAQAVMEFVHGN